MHRLRWIVTVGAAVCLLVVGLLSGGCSQKQPGSSPGSPPPGKPGMEGTDSGSGPKQFDVGDNLPLAHLSPVKGGDRYRRPMGGLCTCALGVPQGILMLGQLDDPELLAVAQKADKHAAQAGEEDCLALVVTPGPKDDEHIAAARKWQEEKGLDHSLVTITESEQHWKQLGAPDQLTILIVDDANMVTFKQVGYNDDNKATFEAALKPKA